MVTVNYQGRRHEYKSRGTQTPKKILSQTIIGDEVLSIVTPQRASDTNLNAFQGQFNKIQQIQENIIAHHGWATKKFLSF